MSATGTDVEQCDRAFTDDLTQFLQRADLRSDIGDERQTVGVFDAIGLGGVLLAQREDSGGGSVLLTRKSVHGPGDRTPWVLGRLRWLQKRLGAMRLLRRQVLGHGQVLGYGQVLGHRTQPRHSEGCAQYGRHRNPAPVGPDPLRQVPRLPPKPGTHHVAGSGKDLSTAQSVGDRTKFRYAFDGVGPRCPWYFDPTEALPYGCSDGLDNRNRHS